MTQNLLDILSTIIGFSAVMLLLSLLVTALVQAMQATIRLRSRNLKKGIVSLLDSVVGKHEANNERAAQIMNSNYSVVLGKKENPNSGIARMMGPSASYISKEDIQQAIGDIELKLGPDQLGKLEAAVIRFWDRLGKQMEKRFLLLIRIITVGCAIAVAGYFQVSTPELLNKLSTDSIARAKYAEMASELMGETGTRMGVLSRYEDVSEEALLMLEKKYPELEEKIEEASGVGEDKEAILAELERVLENEPKKRTSVINSYEKILDNLYEEKRAESLKQVQEISGKLARIDIRPWAEGIGFYYRRTPQWSHIFGVLATVIFLTFGAPFWFKVLSETTKLKDILSIGIKGKKTEKTESTEE